MTWAILYNEIEKVSIVAAEHMRQEFKIVLVLILP